jgi:hypothetical protein
MKGLGFGMVWDKQIFRNVWIWMVYGGLKNYPWYGRAYAVALEPWSSVPDDLAEAVKAGTQMKLEPGEKICTSLKAIAYESDRRVSKICSEGKVKFIEE